MTIKSFNNQDMNSFRFSIAEHCGSKIRNTGFRIALFVLFLLAFSSPAWATIETIKGTLSCFNGCNKDKVQLIAQGVNYSFEVVGQFVDLSTGVEISGSGVSVSYGTRKNGAGSSIVVNLDVADSATPGERTVKMHYFTETNGPDVFKVQVVRKGSISQIRYKRPLLLSSSNTIPLNPDIHPSNSVINLPGSNSGIGSGPTELVPATNLPLNKKIVLVVSGTKLTNVQVSPGSDYRNERILTGATDSSCEIEIEFTQSGVRELSLFDTALSTTDMVNASSKFAYAGGTNRRVEVSGSQTGSLPPIPSSVSATPSTFIDVAPRANMVNIFRRLSNFPPIVRSAEEIDGVKIPQFTVLRVEDRWCEGMSISQNASNVITVPKPTWGVSNVGTQDINTNFQVRLMSGSQMLQQETVTNLGAGATKDFTYNRPGTSQVRVRRFGNLNANLQGCYASPDDTHLFFEDPPFTVVVDTGSVLGETQNNIFNNSRNY